MPYRYDIRLLPDNIRNELEGLKNDSDVKDYLKYGNTGELGDLLKEWGRRYGDGIESYFHMIFPWYQINSFEKIGYYHHKQEKAGKSLSNPKGTFVKARKNLVRAGY